MLKIKWDDSLSVGVNLIDDQHKMLITRLNDMSNAVEMHQGLEKIMKTLDFLIKYTDFHFGTEEKHMTKFCYPGMDYHKKQHEKFKSTLNNLVEDFKEEGATEVLANSIDTFLINWLINHIKIIDIEFGKFLNEKGFECTE